MIKGNVQPVRGYAWFVSPDPGGITTEHPFSETPPDPTAPAPVVPKPPGVPAFWTIGPTALGVRNRSGGGGHAYLVLTETMVPPRVGQGWLVDPADLADDFSIDQQGDRWVRLVRVIHTEATDRGPIRDCEFEILRD